MKRIFDLIFSALGLILLAPVFLILALLIKGHDKGPVFFRQFRVGRSGRLFRIWKFRTMIPGAGQLGGAITVGQDSRITPLGHSLRRFKLDEFPQLINVLLGEMSLVGPRPEVEKYVKLYTLEQKQVLDLMPGITDPASFAFYDESSLLAKVADADRFYQEKLMPEKIRINLDYATKASLFSDFILIVATLAHAVGIKIDIFRWLNIRAPELSFEK